MNIFQQLIKSLYSTKTIVRFRFQKIGKTILYVFLLSLLSIIPITYYVTSTVKDEVAITTSFIKDQLPSFTIEDGKLISENNNQVLSSNDELALEFNPTATKADKTVLFSDQGISLLQNQLVVIQNGEEKTFSYDTVKGYPVTKNDLLSFADTFQSMFPLFVGIIILLMLFFSAFSYFISTLFLSIIGYILTQNRKMQFKQLFTLSAYSLTIPTVFFFIMDFLKTPIPYSSVIFSFSGLIILYTVLRELPKPRPKQ
ncbi:MAG: DUF1189 domain-containing protein [Bacillaceae bacterium]